MSKEEKTSSSDLEVTEKVTEFKSGLTWRSWLALFYSLFVFTPAEIWISLNVVQARMPSIAVITLVIFSEIAALYGKPLTKQEAAIIFGPASAAGSMTFLSLVYNAYYVRSPLIHRFNINPANIPTWWAPPITSNAFDVRTFANYDWFVPIIVALIAHLLGMFGGLFFGLLGRELFVESERLPFPIQRISVATIETLSERKEDRMTVFAWTGIFSLIYGIVAYTIPAYSSAMGISMRFISVPWYDYSLTLERIIPGGSFGIATDLLILASGLIIPAPVVIGMFAGSVARFLVVNPLLVKLGMSDWATRWTPGMSFNRIWQDSTLYFWVSPLIGVGFALGIIPIVFRGKSFINSLKTAFRVGRKTVEYGERISGPPVPGVVMILLSTSLVGVIIFDLALVPGFPIWALILYEIVMPFVILLASGRAVAVTGQEIDFPYLRQLTIMVSGYGGLDAWFLPLTLNPGTGWMNALKISQLTGTSASSWIKANLIAYPLAFLTGYIYMQLFWQIAPIPSDTYPAPGIQWPISIVNQSVWITRPAEFFQPITIVSWFGGFGVLVAVLDFLKMGGMGIGAASGFSIPIPVATTIFLGFIVKLVVTKIKGKAWVDTYRATMAAGLGLGESAAIIIGVALALAAKAVWAGIY